MSPPFLTAQHLSFLLEPRNISRSLITSLCRPQRLSLHRSPFIDISPRLVANLQWRMERRFIQELQFRSCRSITRRRCSTSIIENEGGNEADLLWYGVCLSFSLSPPTFIYFRGISFTFLKEAENKEKTRERGEGVDGESDVDRCSSTRFTEMSTSRFVESAFWNFDSMFVPQQHPAREVQDTFYVKSKSLLFSLFVTSCSSSLRRSPSSHPSRPFYSWQSTCQGRKKTNTRPTKSRSTRWRILSTSSKSPWIRRIRFNRLQSSILPRRLWTITLENTYDCCFDEYVVQDR